MRYCTNCGTQIADESRFCTSCGKEMPVLHTADILDVSEPESAVSEPVKEQQTIVPPRQQNVEKAGSYNVDSPVVRIESGQLQQIQYMEEPISTAGYIGIFFLMMLPVINVIMLVIWACGGCGRKNKTNLSRAILFWWLISLLLGTIVMLAGGLVFGEYFDYLRELGDEFEAMM